MSRIEDGLHAHHASLQSAPTPSFPASIQESQQDQPGHSGSPRIAETPFAKVNSVVAGSPADDAGLRAGDRIRAFGTVNWMNHEKLSKVAGVVQRSEGVCIENSLEETSANIIAE